MDSRVCTDSTFPIIRSRAKFYPHRFDSQHSLPYYVDIRDPNHPRSQWAIPYYYSTNAPQALASGFQDTDSTRGIISKLENHLLPHHQLQYNSDFQKGNKPSSGYQVGYIGQNQHYQPEHTQSASSHSSGSSWLSAGAARVGGMAVGGKLLWIFLPYLGSEIFRGSTRSRKICVNSVLTCLPLPTTNSLDTIRFWTHSNLDYLSLLQLFWIMNGRNINKEKLVKLD